MVSDQLQKFSPVFRPLHQPGGRLCELDERPEGAEGGPLGQHAAALQGVPGHQVGLSRQRRDPPGETQVS